jgi:hypothetical protein
MSCHCLKWSRAGTSLLCLPTHISFSSLFLVKAFKGSHPFFDRRAYCLKHWRAGRINFSFKMLNCSKKHFLRIPNFFTAEGCSLHGTKVSVDCFAVENIRCLSSQDNGSVGNSYLNTFNLNYQLLLSLKR